MVRSASAHAEISIKQVETNITCTIHRLKAITGIIISTSHNGSCEFRGQHDEIERRRRHPIDEHEFRHEDGPAPELDQVAEQEGQHEQVQVPQQGGQAAGQIACGAPCQCQESSTLFGLLYLILYRGLVVSKLGWDDLDMRCSTILLRQ